MLRVLNCCLPHGMQGGFTPRSRLASSGWRTAREWASSQNLPPTPPGSQTSRSHLQPAASAAQPLPATSRSRRPGSQTARSQFGQAPGAAQPLPATPHSSRIGSQTARSWPQQVVSAEQPIPSAPQPPACPADQQPVTIFHSCGPSAATLQQHDCQGGSSGDTWGAPKRAMGSLKQDQHGARARGVRPLDRPMRAPQNNGPSGHRALLAVNGSHSRKGEPGLQGAAAARLVSLSPRIQSHGLRPARKPQPMPAQTVNAVGGCLGGPRPSLAGSDKCEQACIATKRRPPYSAQSSDARAADPAAEDFMGHVAESERAGDASMHDQQPQLHTQAASGVLQSPLGPESCLKPGRPAESAVSADGGSTCSSSVHTSSCSSTISSGTSSLSCPSRTSAETEARSQAEVSSKRQSHALKPTATCSHEHHGRAATSVSHPDCSRSHFQHGQEQILTEDAHSNGMGVLDRGGTAGGKKPSPRVPMLSLGNLQNQQGPMCMPQGHNPMLAGGSENVSPSKTGLRPHGVDKPHKQPAQKSPKASPTKSPKKSPKKLLLQKPMVPKLALGAMSMPGCADVAAAAPAAAQPNVSELQAHGALPQRSPTRAPLVPKLALGSIGPVADAPPAASMQDGSVQVVCCPGKIGLKGQLPQRPHMLPPPVPQLALEGMGLPSSDGLAASMSVASALDTTLRSQLSADAEHAQKPSAAAAAVASEQRPDSTEHVPTATYDLMPTPPGQHASTKQPRQQVSLHPLTSAEPQGSHQIVLPMHQLPGTPLRGMSRGPPGGSLTSRALDPHACVMASPRAFGMARSQVQIQPPLTARSRLQTSTTSLDPEPGEIIRRKAAARCGSMAERGSPRTPVSIPDIQTNPLSGPYTSARSRSLSCASK